MCDVWTQTHSLVSFSLSLSCLRLHEEGSAAVWFLSCREMQHRNHCWNKPLESLSSLGRWATALSEVWLMSCQPTAMKWYQISTKPLQLYRFCLVFVSTPTFSALPCSSAHALACEGVEENRTWTTTSPSHWSLHPAEILWGLLSCWNGLSCRGLMGMCEAGSVTPSELFCMCHFLAYFPLPFYYSLDGYRRRVSAQS